MITLVAVWHSDGASGVDAERAVRGPLQLSRSDGKQVERWRNGSTALSDQLDLGRGRGVSGLIPSSATYPWLPGPGNPLLCPLYLAECYFWSHLGLTVSSLEKPEPPAFHLMLFNFHSDHSSWFISLHSLT